MRNYFPAVGVICFFCITVPVSNASAASVYGNEFVFRTQVGATIFDNYSNPGYLTGDSSTDTPIPGATIAFFSDQGISNVLGETAYIGDLSSPANIVSTSSFSGGSRSYYCYGCNWSFTLDFTNTSVTNTGGVYGVGLNIGENQSNAPSPNIIFDAIVNFADSSTVDYSLPFVPYTSQSPVFWGITSDVPISSIHITAPGGGVSGDGSFHLDALTIAGKPSMSIVPTIPTPTATPPLASFPTPDQVMQLVGQFISSDNSQFSFPSQQFNANEPIVQTNSVESFKSIANTIVVGYNDLNQSGGYDAGFLLAGLATNQSDPSGVIASALLDYAVSNLGVDTDSLLYASSKYLFETAIDAATLPLNPTGAIVSFALDTADFWTSHVIIPALTLIDPVDPEYTSVASAEIPALPALPTTGDATVDSYLEQLLSTEADAVGYLRALQTTLDRYSAAYNAGDSISAGLQVSALLHYMSLAQASLADLGQQWAGLPPILQRLGFDPNVDMTVYYDQIKSLIVSNGISPDLQAFLLNLGLTQADISNLVDSFLGYSPTGVLSGDIVTNLSSFGQSLSSFSTPTTPSPTSVPSRTRIRPCRFLSRVRFSHLPSVSCCCFSFGSENGTSIS